MDAIKSGAEEPLFNRSSNPDDSFYETINRNTEYDNNLNNKPMDEEELAKQQEEWRKELAKLEDEIHTLQSVLSSKIRCAGELKRKLGVTPYVEFKQDLESGVQAIKESTAYQFTNEKLTHLNDSIHSSPAYQKTSDAFKNFGVWSSKKLGDARNSTAFKSFEERVGGAYSSVKTKMSGSRSENSFNEMREGEGVSGGSEQKAPPPAADTSAATPTPSSDTPTTPTDKQ